MLSAHLHLIKTYGYLGIFSSLVLGIFGLPLPDETILAFVGYLISKHYFQPVPALLTAFGASACGITISYGLGRGFGLPLLGRFGKYLHVTPERLAQAHQWFEKYGKWSLFGGYFLPGVRHLTALSAGISGLEYRHFAPFAYTGGFLWVATFLTTGYLLGEEWRTIMPLIHTYLWLLVGGLAVLGVAACLVYRLRRRGSPG